MTRKKGESGAEKAAQTKDAEPQETVASESQAEARRSKGYIGSAPGEDTNDTVTAVTEKDSRDD